MLKQLYLPYRNFRRSVTCYSDALLLETLKTIRRNRGYMQQQNPFHLPEDCYYIWQDWSNHYQAFSRLAVFCYEECLERGLPVSHSRLRGAKKEVAGNWTKPHWVGWEARHARHRANLLAIGASENVALRICVGKFWEFNVRTDAVRRVIWDNYHGACWHSLNMIAVQNMHNYLDDLNVPRYYGNHYWQFNWTEEPTATPLCAPSSEEYLVC